MAGNGKQRFLCSGCRRSTKLLERDAPDVVRTGCDACNAIMRFIAYGSPAFSTQIPPRGGR